MDLDEEQHEIAKQIEKEMRDHGFSDNLIMGAIVNAYAESRLKPSAVGTAGERGVFQLHPRGMGKGMQAEEMHDIRGSVDRIAVALKKNRRIMKLERGDFPVEDHVRAFCIEIERPSDKFARAERRVKLLQKILK